MKKTFFQITVLAIAIVSISAIAYAGSLTPATAPAGTLYSLENIFAKLQDNTASATEGGAGIATPGSVSTTMHSLKDIYNAIPTLDASKIATGTTYMGVQGTMTGFGLLKTGQTVCRDVFDDDMPIIPCAGTGFDGESQAGVSIPNRFVKNGITISDTATKILWQECPLGSATNGGAECIPSDPAIRYGLDFAGSFAACNALDSAGYDDWRVPNFYELSSVINFDSDDAVAYLLPPFPNPTSGPPTLTSTRYIGGQSSYYSFISGGFVGGRAGTFTVFCVRSL